MRWGTGSVFIYKYLIFPLPETLECSILHIKSTRCHQPIFELFDLCSISIIEPLLLHKQNSLYEIEMYSLAVISRLVTQATQSLAGW